MTDTQSDRDHVSGVFHTPIHCPECGSFMRTGYDPHGLPSARCPNVMCDVGQMPDDWLRNNGHWEEA